MFLHASRCLQNKSLFMAKNIVLSFISLAYLITVPNTSYWFVRIGTLNFSYKFMYSNILHVCTVFLRFSSFNNLNAIFDPLKCLLFIQHHL